MPAIVPKRPSRAPGPAPPGILAGMEFTRTGLSEAGFAGFVRIADTDTNGSGVPKKPGVYAVLREKTDLPVFLPEGTGGKRAATSPYGAGQLRERWTPG